MDIEIRELKKVDLVPDLLEHFNRYQEIVNVWREIDGKKLLIENPFIENWDNELKGEIVNEDFTNCINSGGIVFGMFYKGNLIAFASLLHDFFGSQNQYVQLMQLHISSEYRRLGLGKRLFTVCVKKAKEWGAKKLYISGHSAEETQQFYTAVGCVDAKEINDEIANHEPYDIQLEYEILDSVNSDKETIRLAGLREKYILDERSRIEGAREEGLKVGIKEGIEQEKTW